ncbi:MAG: glycosyltransferase family 9 protein [Chthoniobacter sp.]
MKRLILVDHYSPGDAVLLTAAIRDLHRTYPAAFLTGIQSPYRDLWANNPFITDLAALQGKAKIVECQAPLVQSSNRSPNHVLAAFIDFLNKQLKLEIEATEFRGDIHLSNSERAAATPIEEITGQDMPYWIISAGGKFDYTVKWWDVQRYQGVVDHFRGRILFVQVGEKRHYHPPLTGVLDLRGKTNLRQLIHLVHGAQGVMCPVTLLMHLAAAVETRKGMPSTRACVVVAGGREPSQWGAYPTHQFIHTTGVLKCCESGGCWRARTIPLGDGDRHDRPEYLCTDVIMYKDGRRHRLGNDWNTRKASAVEDARYLPHCMDLISSHEAIRRIELYFAGGALRYLNSQEARAAELATSHQTAPSNGSSHPIMKSIAQRRVNSNTAPMVHSKESESPIAEHQRRFDECVAGTYRYPRRRFYGRGIVMCGGGEKYFPCIWVCLNILRKLGCGLPIELWHLGADELTPHMRHLIISLERRA